MLYNIKKITEDFLNKAEQAYKECNGDCTIVLSKNKGIYKMLYEVDNNLKTIRLSAEEYWYLVKSYFPKLKKCEPRLDRQEYLVQTKELNFE